MTAKPQLPITEEIKTKDGALADAIERELKRLPSDDPALEQRCVIALNKWLGRARSGTFTQFLHRAQGIIRRQCHPDRPILKAAAVRIDVAVMPSVRVRQVVERELEDLDLTAEDLKRIHEGLTQLKRMPDAKEPWRTTLERFLVPNPVDRNLPAGFTPDGFLEAARAVVWTVLASYD